jgi:hypothetical protein
VAVKGFNPDHPYLQAGINKYIKKKQLDPLETYVPLVLEARQQLDLLPDSFGEWQQSSAPQEHNCLGFKA